MKLWSIFILELTLKNSLIEKATIKVAIDNNVCHQEKEQGFQPDVPRSVPSRKLRCWTRYHADKRAVHQVDLHVNLQCFLLRNGVHWTELVRGRTLLQMLALSNEGHYICPYNQVGCLPCRGLELLSSLSKHLLERSLRQNAWLFRE